LASAILGDPLVTLRDLVPVVRVEWHRTLLFFLRAREHLSAHADKVAHGSDGDEEDTGRVPIASILGDATGRDEAMDVGWRSCWVQACRTASTPTVPPTKRRSRASSMIASAAAVISEL
jgi:hypothetical protein